MKANHRLRPLFATAAATALMAVASCTGPRVVPAPAPAPTPAPPPSPTPTPSPAPTPTPPPAVRPSVDWQDAPITPGVWSWSREGNQSVARFAGGLLVMRCNLANRTVTLERAGGAAGEVPMTVVTDRLSRPLTGIVRPGAPPAITVTFGALDPLLDAMAFSRGRFALEATGMPTLYVPSWPEISRVIEDCR